MLKDQVVENNKLLVELSVVPLGVNGKSRDQIADVQDIVERAGIFNERTANGTYFEGDWSDICTLLYSCYEQVRTNSSHSYLKIAIR